MRMGLVLAALSLALGCLLVLIGNPLQVMPRYMRSLRYVAIARGWRRWRAEYRIKPAFLRLTLLAKGLLLLWFFIAMLAPISEDMVLSRVVLGIGLGGFLSWSLFCRREILFADLGIIGFYPNARMVVSWDYLAGYVLLADEPRILALVNKAGHLVEAMPIADDMEQREIELALAPYLSRLEPADCSMQELSKNARRLLVVHYAWLLVATLPLLTLLVLRFVFHVPVIDTHLIAAIVLAVVIPFYVSNWAERFHYIYCSNQGHVSVAQLVSLCHRCFYQAVCWQSGLHQRVYWDRDRQARMPSWEEFCKGFRHKPKITADIYHTCCRCLAGHLQAQDLYHVNLIPLNPKQPD